ncbi:transposable element Tcb2 transposase [Trichonephila clavipes]|nr:transposable element Tcb2 transposase [Trichonephila clavipes]
MYPLCKIVGSSGQGMLLPQGGHMVSTERNDCCIWHIAVAHGKLRARYPVVCIPLTPSHLRWEWRSVVFYDESRFCLGASDGCVLVRRKPGEHLQPNCMWSRHTGHTPEVMIWGAISCDSWSTFVVIPKTLTANLYISLVIQPIVLPFKEEFLPHTVVVMLCAVQRVDMLPWPARSPDLSQIKHV